MVVAPTVFPPFITISTKLLLEFIEELPLNGKTFLELGCGCGIISILAAKKGAFVTATDINQTALETLQKNADDNSVAIQIMYSDLFESLEGSFNFIIINPPYYPKNPTSISESAWYCGENFNYFEKLFLQLPKFIDANNQTYLILSEDCEVGIIKSIAIRNGLKFNLVVERMVAAEKNYLFSIDHA